MDGAGRVGTSATSGSSQLFDACRQSCGGLGGRLPLLKLSPCCVIVQHVFMENEVMHLRKQGGVRADHNHRHGMKEEGTCAAMRAR
jgi:hypothetical protein